MSLLLAQRLLISRTIKRNDNLTIFFYLRPLGCFLNVSSIKTKYILKQDEKQSREEGDF